MVMKRTGSYPRGRADSETAAGSSAAKLRTSHPLTVRTSRFAGAVRPPAPGSPGPPRFEPSTRGSFPPAIPIALLPREWAAPTITSFPRGRRLHGRSRRGCVLPTVARVADQATQVGVVVPPLGLTAAAGLTVLPGPVGHSGGGTVPGILFFTHGTCTLWPVGGAILEHVHVPERVLGGGGVPVNDFTPCTALCSGFFH